MVALSNHKDFTPENLKELRIINNVAPIETLRSFQDKVPQASQVSAYGLTEVGGVTSFGSPDDTLENRLTTCGKPWPCLLYTSPSPRDMRRTRMPSSA